jgi:hypothetical protein
MRGTFYCQKLDLEQLRGTFLCKKLDLEQIDQVSAVLGMMGGTNLQHCLLITSCD